MNVRELMKENPCSITPDATLQQAARMMIHRDCGILPVVAGTRSKPLKRPVGVLTDRDIVCRAVVEGTESDHYTVADACTQDVVSCDAECSAADAFSLMRREKVGRLMVLNASGELIGIVSMADIIARAPADIWTQLPGARSHNPSRAA